MVYPGLVISGAHLMKCRRRYSLMLLLPLLAASLPAYGGFYVHGSVGYARYSASGDYLGSKSTDRLRGADLSGTLGAGYRFTDWLAVEAAHLQMDALPTPASLLRHGVRGSGQRMGLQMNGALTEGVGLFLRGGSFRWDVSIKPALQHGSDDYQGRDHFLGTGLHFPARGRLVGQLGWEQYRIEDIRMNYILVGAEFRLRP